MPMASRTTLLPIAGETRICLNILHEGNQTELLESGPQIAPAELEAFTAKFAELAAKADVVTLSGSLPLASMPATMPSSSRSPRRRAPRCCSTPRVHRWRPRWSLTLSLSS